MDGALVLFSERREGQSARSVSNWDNYVDTKWHSLDSNKMCCSSTAANHEFLGVSQTLYIQIIIETLQQFKHAYSVGFPVICKNTVLPKEMVKNK